jgi:hypothetical protein
MELTENNQPIFINEVLDKFYLLLDQLDTKTKVSIISKISESILKETDEKEKQDTKSSVLETKKIDISFQKSLEKINEKNKEILKRLAE